MQIIIRNSDARPLYEQVSAQIKRAILMGELCHGEALPSIRLLAKELRISVITTKRAYEELEREGFLTMVPGKGCFVEGRNKALLREEHLRRTEACLNQALAEADLAGLSLEELQTMLALLSKGD